MPIPVREGGRGVSTGKICCRYHQITRILGLFQTLGQGEVTGAWVIYCDTD